MSSYNFLPTISSTNQTQTTAPSWAPQVGALTQAFGGAQNAYAKQLGMGDYNGDYVAAPNQTQYDAYNQAGDFSAANGGVGQNQINTGQGLLNNYGTASNAAGALYNFGNTNQTQSNINTANAYANNPYIADSVRAASAMARQDAAENAVPSIYRSAASSGNLNSDRAALAQGVVERGLAQNEQSLMANAQNNAWNTGLNTAMNQNSQSLGALSNAGNLSSGLGGAGSSMMSQGINDQTNLSNLYATAGSGLNALQQSILNNDLAKRQGAISDTWSPVQNLYNIAGANNWGQTSNTSGTSIGISPVQNQQSPGALSYLGAGMGVAGSIAGTAVGGPAGGTIGGMAAGALGRGISNYFGGGTPGMASGTSGMQFPIFDASGNRTAGGWY